MKDSINIEEIRSSLSLFHGGFSFDWLSPDQLELALKLGQDLHDYSRMFWEGLYQDFLKRSSQNDVGFKCYKNIKELPISEIVPDIRLIKRDKRPSNKRKRAPDYTEIRKLWHLTSRDVWLAEQEMLIDIAATRLGRSIFALTPSVAPINHYSPSFMSSPAKAPGNPREMNVKAAIRQVASFQSHETVVTIWCENSKAMQRYSTEFTRKLVIIYPEGYTTSEFDTQHKYLKSNYPLIEVVKIHSVSEEKLRSVSSKEFVDMYGLPTNALFCINFLPQFMHLRYEFSSFMCVYTDIDNMSASIQLSFPEVSGTMSEQLNYYNNWIIEKFPNEIINGHCGFFDELLGLRLSYSQHGTFLDYVPTFDSMTGSDFRTLRLADYLGLDSEQMLRVALPHHYFDDFREEDEEATLVPHFEFDICNSIDLSCIDFSTKVLYVPAYSYAEVEVDIDGTLRFATFMIPGLDPGRIYRVVVMEDCLKILDVSYSKRNYYRRQSGIPEEYRIQPSSTQRAPLSYVIFPQTRTLVGDYSVSLEKKFRYYSDPLIADVTFSQYVIPGFAWNNDINASVWDIDSYIYLTTLDVPAVSKAKHIRSYEFPASVSLRRAKKFKLGEYYVTIINSSSEDRTTSAGLYDVFGATSLPSRIVAALSIVMILWSAGSIDEEMFIDGYGNEEEEEQAFHSSSDDDHSGEYEMVGFEHFLTQRKFYYRNAQSCMVQGDVLDLRLGDGCQYIYGGYEFSCIYKKN